MTPVFGVLLTALMLPDESNVNIINLIISLILVCVGVFLLNYTHKPRQKCDLEPAATETDAPDEG